MDNIAARVLVVDDDPDLLASHSMHLESLGCEVETAENGRLALDKLGAAPESIDIIISDVIMPEMDGFEFCEQVKLNPDTADIPLIFVSQLDTLEDKLKGFDAGVDDYITKPISPEELGYKIRKLLKLRIENKELQKQLGESNTVAMQAMTVSSDLGQILEFYKNTMGARDFEEIARLMFDVTNCYGLNCSLQIVAQDGLKDFGSQGVVSPLESNLIEVSRSKGRFFDFGARTLINYDDFSLLVKNMPVDDVERYGILKDSLGSLCNAIESRVKFLLYESANLQKERVVNTVIEMMEEVDKQFGLIQQANTAVITSMLDELDEAMMDLGLTDNQEELIRSVIITGRDKSNKAFKAAEALYDKFDEVKAKLDEAMSS